MGEWVRKRKPGSRQSELVYVPDEYELEMGIDAETMQRTAAPFQTALIAGGGDPNSQGGRAMIGSSAGIGDAGGSPWLQSYLDAGLVQSGQIHPPRGTPSIIEAMKLPRDRLGREVEKKKADKRQTVTKTDADGNVTTTVTDTEDLDTIKDIDSMPWVVGSGATSPNFNWESWQDDIPSHAFGVSQDYDFPLPVRDETEVIAEPTNPALDFWMDRGDQTLQEAADALEARQFDDEASLEADVDEGFDEILDAWKALRTPDQAAESDAAQIVLISLEEDTSEAAETIKTQAKKPTTKQRKKQRHKNNNKNEVNIQLNKTLSPLLGSSAGIMFRF